MRRLKKVNKNIIAIGMALVIAIATALLLKLIVDKKISESLSTETVSYVVANTDLRAGSLVDPFDQSMYAVRNDIPADFAQSNAITPDQAGIVEGAILLADLKRGDILTWQAIDTDETRQLATKLLPGRRALTIPVDDQSSISSMLKPNDKIDLILTYQKNQSIIAAPLLQNIRVLATGDSLSNNDRFYDPEGYADYNTITLDLSIDEVSKVTTALELGRLSAVLRNPDDTSFTQNVVSLRTLQNELKLRTYIEPTVEENDKDSVGSYLEQLNKMEQSYEQKMNELIDQLDAERSKETYVPDSYLVPQLDTKNDLSKNPSIPVIYGNRVPYKQTSE